MATTLRRELGVTSLILTVVTGTIGSGWLFAPYFCARIAGPSSLLAWLLGGAMAFLLAMVFAELGGLVNSLVRWPRSPCSAMAGLRLRGRVERLDLLRRPTNDRSAGPAAVPLQRPPWLTRDVATPRCSVVPVS